MSSISWQHGVPAGMHARASGLLAPLPRLLLSPIVATPLGRETGMPALRAEEWGVTCAKPLPINYRMQGSVQ